MDVKTVLGTKPWAELNMAWTEYAFQRFMETRKWPDDEAKWISARIRENPEWNLKMHVAGEI